MTNPFETLLAAVSGSAAAFRSVTKLQPVGGVGDKVFPATFAGGKYAKETRYEDTSGSKRDVLQCVLLDSVASQANRAEDVLLQAVQSGELRLPLIEVDFEAIDPPLPVPLPKLSSLQVPHRLF